MNKLIISALLMVGLVGIIGTAVAVHPYIDADLSVDGDPVSLDIGQTDTQPVTMVVTGTATGKDITEIRVVNVPTGISVSIDGHPGTVLTDTADTWGTSKTWTISYTNVNAANGDYVITYQVDYKFDKGCSTATRESTIQTGLNLIPEFPTVALPIAAILGLMFIISSRKKKE